MIRQGEHILIQVLKGMPKFVAYNARSSFYMEFDRKPTITSAKLLFLDEAGVVLKPNTEQLCWLALMENNQSQVAQMCKYTIHTNAMTPDIFIMDRRHVLLTNVTNAMIICGNDNDQNVTCQATCKLVLACGYSLRAEKTFIPAASMADRALESVQTLHSVNLGFLAHFFKKMNCPNFIIPLCFMIL